MKIFTCSKRWAGIWGMIWKSIRKNIDRSGTKSEMMDKDARVRFSKGDVATATRCIVRGRYK